jgi:hypothetical protein
MRHQFLAKGHIHASMAERRLPSWNRQAVDAVNMAFSQRMRITPVLGRRPRLR